MKLLAFAFFFSLQVFAGGGRELPTADFVDINRYIGRWYTITSLPQFFTRNCIGQTADYGIINEQSISVVNTCLKKNGSSKIKGQAVIVNSETNAELVVTFNSFFTRLFRVKGDYTIIRLDPEYRYVLIGDKDRKSMWVLSRTKQMPENELADYVKTADELDFPVKKLIPSKYE